MFICFVVIKSSKCKKEFSFAKGAVFHFRYNESYHEAAFLCDDKYEMTEGYDPLVCMENEGKWQGSTPKCAGKKS